VTLEISSWLVTVRVFMDGPLRDDAMYDALERELEATLIDLGPREGEPWALHLMLVRQDSPAPVRALGQLIWRRQGTKVEPLGLDGD
jgi:hypothetical protein